MKFSCVKCPSVFRNRKNLMSKSILWKLAEKIMPFAWLTHRVPRLTMRQGLTTCISCPIFLKKILKKRCETSESFVFSFTRKNSLRFETSKLGKFDFRTTPKEFLAKGVKFESHGSNSSVSKIYIWFGKVALGRRFGGLDHYELVEKWLTPMSIKPTVLKLSINLRYMCEVVFPTGFSWWNNSPPNHRLRPE